MADNNTHSSDVKRKNPLHHVGKGVKKTGTAVVSVFEDFMNFIKKGNVVDLAVGIVMGAAFTAIVNSFVTDIITPFMGFFTAKNLQNNFAVIRCPSVPAPNSTVTCTRGFDHEYPTTAIATAAGAVTWNYGNFIQLVINFFVVSLFVYFIVKAYSATFLRLQKKEAAKTRTCPMCAEDVSIKALKCKHCHERLPPLEPVAEATPNSSISIPIFHRNN